MDRMSFPEVIAAVLALLAFVALFAFVGALFFVTVPPDNSEMLFTAGGVLFGIANLAAGYYLGSSAGSKAKDATVATLAEAPRPTPDQERI